MMNPLLSILLVLSTVVVSVSSHDFPEQHQQPFWEPPTSKSKRIAIIGAGSAGASSAYYLRQYASSAGVPLELTVFERSSYIGGRSTTVYAHDDPSQPVELGASIFVEVNRNLVSAVEAFNLSVGASLDRETLGIWNGQDFVWIQPLGGSRWQSWWSRARLIYRYGLAPLHTLNLMKTVVGRFLKMYDEPYFPWRDLSQVAYDVGLTGVTAMTGEQYLQENGIGELFAKEVVQASTRVNYAQNLGSLHGLETMVCMAADGAMSVQGGNWQIFAGMLSGAGAIVQLNTSVASVERREDGRFTIGTKSYYSSGLGRVESPASVSAIYIDETRPGI